MVSEPERDIDPAAEWIGPSNAGRQRDDNLSYYCWRKGLIQSEQYQFVVWSHSIPEVLDILRWLDRSFGWAKVVLETKPNRSSRHVDDGRQDVYLTLNFYHSAPHPDDPTGHYQAMRLLYEKCLALHQWVWDSRTLTDICFYTHYDDDDTDHAFGIAGTWERMPGYRSQDEPEPVVPGPASDRARALLAKLNAKRVVKIRPAKQLANLLPPTNHSCEHTGPCKGDFEIGMRDGLPSTKRVA